jgi:hypothetical protein
VVECPSHKMGVQPHAAVEWLGRFSLVCVSVETDPDQMICRQGREDQAVLIALFGVSA